MADKNPLDDIVSDIVVFKDGATGNYISNSPLWNDSRIREHWHNTKSDESLAKQRAAAEAKARLEEDGGPIEDDPDDDYETWTNEDLRTELAGRKLSVDGKKVDLVARLRADDEKAQG